MSSIGVSAARSFFESEAAKQTEPVYRTPMGADYSSRQQLKPSSSWTNLSTYKQTRPAPVPINSAETTQPSMVDLDFNYGRPSSRAGAAANTTSGQSGQTYYTFRTRRAPTLSPPPTHLVNGGHLDFGSHTPQPTSTLPTITNGILDNAEIDRIFNEERRKMAAKDGSRRLYTPSITGGTTGGGYDSRNDRLLSASPFRAQSALSVGTTHLAAPQLVPSRAHSPGMQAGDAASLRGVAKALYSFVAHNQRELSFRKGDLIRILRQIDQNWYEGELNRRQGIVPVNYVEMAAVAKPDSGLHYTEVEENTEGRAKVLYDFEPRVAIELHLKRGDYVTLRRRIDDNWYEGWAPSGKGGIFPANYIQVLEEPMARNKRISNDSNSPADSGVSSQYQTAGYNPIQQRGGRPSVIAPKTMYQSTAPHSRPTSSLLARAPSPKAFDRHLDVKSHELRQIARSLDGQGARPPPDAQLYRALYPYTPQNADELQLNEGDEIYVMEKCDDGWYIGTCTRTGLFGTFPGNYVQSC